MNLIASENRKIVQVGIWLDYKEANIIKIIKGVVNVSSIPSGVNPGKPKGGHRSKTPYGPMDKISEGKHLERRKHQLEDYYKSICEEVLECDEVFIIGPAEAKIGLRKYMSKYRDLYPRLLDVQTVDSITENQKIEKVKAFFKI